MKLKHLFIVIGILAIQCAMAFQEDKPKGAQFFAEQSQDVVQQQQAYTGKVDVYGEVKTKDSQDSEVKSTSDQSNDLARAEARSNKETMANADKLTEEAQRQPNYLGLFTILMGVLILGAVGFKSYSDKNAPVPDHIK